MLRDIMNCFWVIILSFFGLAVVIAAAMYQNKADIAKMNGKKFLKIK